MLMSTSSTATSGDGTVVALAEALPPPPTRTGGDDHPSTTRPPKRLFCRPSGGLNCRSSCADANHDESDGGLPPPVRGDPPASKVWGGHGGKRRDGASYSRGRGGVDADVSESDGASMGVRHRSSMRVQNRAVCAATSRSAPGPRRPPPLLFVGLSAGACLCLLVAASSMIRGPDGGHPLHPSDGGGDGAAILPSTYWNPWWVFDGQGAGWDGDRRRLHLRRGPFRGSRAGGGGGGGSGIERAGIDADDAYRDRPQQRQQQEQQRQRFSQEEFATNNDTDGYGATMQPPSLFPLSSRDLWGLALAVAGLMLAAGGGVGGGGILVPIYTLVLGFSPRHAIPLSNVTVFGGAVANAILNSRKRHPSADRPLVDWDLMVVMEPLTICGALMGSFLNKLLPETLLVVSLVLLLSTTAYNTLRKAKKMHDKESEDWRALAGLEMECETCAQCGGKAADVDGDFHPGRPPRPGEGDYCFCGGSNVCYTLRTKSIEGDVMETTKDEHMIVDDDCKYDEIEVELEALAEEPELVDALPRPSPLPPPKNCEGFRPVLLRQRSSSTVVAVSPASEHEKRHQDSNGGGGASGPVRARSAPLECRDEEIMECPTPSGSPQPVAVHFHVSSLPPSKRKAYEERCRPPQLGDVELVQISYARDQCCRDAGAGGEDEEVGGAGSKRVHGPGTGPWGRRYEPIAAKTTGSSGFTPSDAADHDESAAVLDRILEEERHPPPRNVGTLLVMFVVVIVVNILKGGGAFSPLGVVCGSALFWMAEIFINVWVLSVFAVARSHLVRRAELKRHVGYRYVEGDIEWTPRATVIYPAICCLAGFFAGMFGIGGGIVKGPLMLAMGIHPAVASATSACMILFTSLAATTSYGVFGLLVPDYAVACLGVGFVATLLGQAVMSGLLKRHGRSSYIAFSIGIVVLLSAVCMTIESIVSIMRARDGEAGGDAGGLCTMVE